jgi:hypothetical protein
VTIDRTTYRRDLNPENHLKERSDSTVAVDGSSVAGKSTERVRDLNPLGAG